MYLEVPSIAHALELMFSSPLSTVSSSNLHFLFNPKEVDSWKSRQACIRYFRGHLAFQFLDEWNITFGDVTMNASKLIVPLDRSCLVLKREMIAILIKIFLTVPKVNHKYLVLLFTQTNYKITRVNVVVNEPLWMNPFYSVKYLISYQEHCF